MALFEIVTGIIMTFHLRADSEPHRDVYRDLNSLSLAGRWRPLKYMLAAVVLELFINGPRREKTCLRCFRYSETLTSLISYRD